MPEDGHWLIASSEVVAPHPLKSEFFGGQQNENSHSKLLFLIQNFGVFCFFGENFVTPFSTLANIKGSLPTNSTTPNRLRCRTTIDGENTFPVFGFEHCQQQVFQKVRHLLVVICTPKEAHSRIFVTGGSVFA